MKSVTITGAGVIGLSCAWRLAQRGWYVTVFDSREATGESSWAAAGMLAPGGEIDANVALASMAVRSLKIFPVFVRELEEESGGTIEFRQCGTIEVAMDEAETEALTQRAARQATIGIASMACRYGDLAARAYPGDCVVDPLSINDVLVAACRLRGVVIREREAVTEIVGDGTGVRTARGEYKSDRVLIAAGAWSSTLWPGLPSVHPVRGHVLSFDMEPGLLNTIVRNGRTFLFQRESGTLIAGSSVEEAGFDRTVDTAVAADIHKRAARLLPALTGVTPSDCWNGLSPATDVGPVIGRVRETSVWTAYGHFRNGILLAPDTASTIADEFGSA